MFVVSLFWEDISLKMCVTKKKKKRSVFKVVDFAFKGKTLKRVGLMGVAFLLYYIHIKV